MTVPAWVVCSRKAYTSSLDIPLRCWVPQSRHSLVMMLKKSVLDFFNHAMQKASFLPGSVWITMRHVPVALGRLLKTFSSLLIHMRTGAACGLGVAREELLRCRKWTASSRREDLQARIRPSRADFHVSDKSSGAGVCPRARRQIRDGGSYRNATARHGWQRAYARLRSRASGSEAAHPSFVRRDRWRFPQRMIGADAIRAPRA